MPIYEYLCSHCDMPHTIRQGIKDYNPFAKLHCAHCANGILERQISAAFLEFKGAGWTPKRRKL